MSRSALPLRIGLPRALTLPESGVALVQLLAIVTMTIDHLGAVDLLAPWSRLVGRFALPCFVLMVAYNSLSASPGLLLRRFSLLLVLSQPAWWLAFGFWDSLCILVTLLAMALAVSLRSSPGLALLVVALGLLVSPWVEYGPWPWLLVPLVLWPSLPSLLLALSWPLLQYPSSLPLALFALLGLLLVLLLVRVPFHVPRLPLMLTRYFYPLHLFLIGLTKTWF